MLLNPFSYPNHSIPKHYIHPFYQIILNSIPSETLTPFNSPNTVHPWFRLLITLTFICHTLLHNPPQRYTPHTSRSTHSILLLTNLDYPYPVHLSYLLIDHFLYFSPPSLLAPLSSLRASSLAFLSPFIPIPVPSSSHYSHFHALPSFPTHLSPLFSGSSPLRRPPPSSPSSGPRPPTQEYFWDPPIERHPQPP